jgi:uncharacterized C2H2 Zn-finger protein
MQKNLRIENFYKFPFIKNENALSQRDEEIFCKLCCKHFNKANSYANHLNSKKHKDLEAAAAAAGSNSKETSESGGGSTAASAVDKADVYAVKSDRTAKKLSQMEQALKKDESLVEVEQVEENEMEDEKDWESADEEDEDSFGELKKKTVCSLKDVTILE